MNPTSLKVGDFEFKNLTRIIPTEKLPKKWAEVKPRPVPKGDELETMKMLDERLGQAKTAKQYKHDIWNQSYLQYRSINYYSLVYGGFPTYWNQWGMSVFIPRTFETIESVKTQMMGRAPDFSVDRTGPTPSKEAYDIGHLAKGEYARSKTQVEVAETVHDVNLYGTGIIRTDFVKKQENQNVMKWNPDGTIGYTQELVNIYSGVGSRRVDPYDFYPNPDVDAYRRDKLGWAFERSVTDAWQLREQYRILAEQKAHGVTDKWQYIKPGGDTTNYKYLRTEIDSLYIAKNNPRTPAVIDDIVGRTGFTGQSKTPATTKDKIEVWEYWENDRYIVIADGLILRDSPNPYPHKRIPYVKYNLIDMNEFWSMGYPEIMKWLQVEENLLHDQALNNIIMAVHKMFAVNARYLEDEGELVARPFGIIHLKQNPNVRVTDAIMPIDYSMDMGNYFEFMRMNGSNIQTVTGVSPYMTGGVTKEAKTERATVANRLSFAGQARVREISRHMEDSLVTGIVEDYVDIMQFYYQNASSFDGGLLPVEVQSPEGSYFIKFVTKKIGELTPDEIQQAQREGYRGILGSDDIQGRYKVVVHGGSSLPKDPEDVAKLKLEFFAWAQPLTESSVDPVSGMATQSPMFDMKKIAKEVAKDVFSVNPDDFLYEKAPEPAAVAPTPTPGPSSVPSPILSTPKAVPPELGGNLPTA